MNTNPKNKIATDFEGWPLYKQTLQDILSELGFVIDGDKLTSPLNNPYLNKFIEIAQDDGMGYCPKMQYVTSVDPEYCRLWIDYPDEQLKEDNYQAIGWPDIQAFMRYPWFDKEVYFDPDKNVWFVPNDKIKSSYNNISFPTNS